MVRVGRIRAIMMGIIAVLGIPSARAEMAAVEAPPTSEIGHEKVLERWYGGDFVRSGLDYSSDSINATRLDRWTSNFAGKIRAVTVTAVAKYSANTQNLAVVSDDGTRTDLFTVRGYAFGIESASATISTAEDFKFIRSGNSGAHSSQSSENVDGRDHLVSYSIGPEEDGVYMMFWEDLNLSPSLSRGRSSADYNDLAIETRYDASTIPLPPSAYAGLILLAALMWKRKSLAKAIGA